MFSISDVELRSYERYRFLRPETKLILNNSNEEIFLKTPQGHVEDSVSYETSQKGTPISFVDTSDMIISDEIRVQIFFSQEAQIEPPIIVPPIEQIQWGFQQPSYVKEKEKLLNEYYCDEKREQCKVNLNFLTSFPS